VSDYFSSIKDNPVSQFGLVRKRFDFYNNDTEDNSYIVDSGSVDYRTTATEFVLSSSASNISGLYNNYRIVIAGEFDATRRIRSHENKEFENRFLYSEEFDNAVWVKTGTASVTPNDATAPNGETTADLIEGIDDGASGNIKQTVSGALTGHRYEPSFYIKPVTTSGVTSITHTAGVTYGSWRIDLSLLDAGWSRITRDHAALTVSKEFVGRLGNYGILFKKSSGTGTQSFHLWGAKIEKSEESSMYVKTTDVGGNVPVNLVYMDADWPSTITTSSTYEVIR
jgi:hypothetical protein